MRLIDAHTCGVSFLSFFSQNTNYCCISPFMVITLVTLNKHQWGKSTVCKLGIINAYFSLSQVGGL